MEDVQPNERRLSRKGSTTVPRVRAVRASPCHAKARSVPQRDEPGPSRFGRTPRAVSGRGVRRPAIPPSAYFPQRQVVESPATQTVHADPIPPIRAATPPECIIDLTLDPPSSPARDHVRWLAFRSGQVDICLPRLTNTLTTSVVPDGDARLHLARPKNGIVPVRSTKDFRPRGSPPGKFCQPDALEVVPSGNDSMASENETGLSLDCAPSTHSLSSCGKGHLLLGSHDKPRRVLRGEDSAYVVTAHGVIDQFSVAGALQPGQHIRSPRLPLEESVDDACILFHQGDPIAVLGHAREQNQVTFLDVRHGQASQHIELGRGWNTAKRPGVSAVTSLMFPLKFASGGYDHRVHLWDVAYDLSGASAAELAIKHTSVVHSLLAIMDTSHKLVSVGADRDVQMYDISAERIVRTLRVSCMPYHAHRTESLSCTLLEVAHLETQFEVRDHRFIHQIVQRFGFVTEERRGRYEKADSWSHFVTCGDKNGIVHLWDLRNVSTEVALLPCFSDPIVQVVNIGPRLLACSKRNELAYIDFTKGQ